MKYDTETYYVYDKHYNLCGQYVDVRMLLAYMDMTPEELNEVVDKRILWKGSLMIKTQLITKCVVLPPVTHK